MNLPAPASGRAESRARRVAPLPLAPDSDAERTGDRDDAPRAVSGPPRSLGGIR